MDQILNEFSAEADNVLRSKIQKEKSPEHRQEIAFCAHIVSMEDARTDLLTNPDDPFLFRKWLELQYETTPQDIMEVKDERRKQELVADYIGLKVLKLLGCVHHGSSYPIDPFKEWRYASGQYNLKGLKGPCSVWIGHMGYCWEGTMADNRTGAHTGGPGSS
jgi:hypothetical protein